MKKNITSCIYSNAHWRHGIKFDALPLEYANKYQNVCNNEPLPSEGVGLQARTSAPCRAEGICSDSWDTNQENVKPICPVDPGQPLSYTKDIHSGNTCYEYTEKQWKMQIHKCVSELRSPGRATSFWALTETDRYWYAVFLQTNITIYHENITWGG